MKKLLLSAAFAVTLFGCGYGEPETVSTRSSKPLIQMSSDADISWCDLSLLCDKATDNAYVHLDCGRRSGFTAYLDADGKPYKCKELKARK